MFSRGLFSLSLCLCALPVCAAAPPARDTAPVLASAIDRLLADHWKRNNLTPAANADDLALLRRVTLDLAGRIPTVAEVDAFEADRSSERYAFAVRRLMRGPEFAWHFGTVLDEFIQTRFAGNEAFIGYLRGTLLARKGWDVVFREVMLGPWTDDGRKPARLFLERRARDLDVLTVDTTSAFFGVDISCARCHNHPLVKDWKREHYYGMAAFLVRTTGGKGTVGEKADGEAKFGGKDGERTAAMMFLSGRRIVEPARYTAKAPRFSRREALVRVGLEEQRFLARAFVNRVWEYLLGRGLVDPSDQLHSGNPASVPALLDHLADDFVEHGYDVGRLVSGVVLSRAYRLDGKVDETRTLLGAEHFTTARLRPLSPRQFSRSLTLALGAGTFSVQRLAELDKASVELTLPLDPRTREFSSSTREALFVSNAEAIRKRIAYGEGNLTARLANLADDDARVRLAVRSLLSRSPSDDEQTKLVTWLKRKGSGRSACEDLVWAIAASAEFRFNH